MPIPPAFLRIPPFPGHRADPLARQGSSAIDPQALYDALRRERVGGQFWGRQPHFPPAARRVLAPTSQADLDSMCDTLVDGTVVVLERPGLSVPRRLESLGSDVDYWHLAANAAEIWASADHELALVSALSETPVRLFGSGSFEGCETNPDLVAAQVVGAWSYRSPFDGSTIDPLEAIAQLGEWRRLIDGNRRIAGVFGAARWKRVTLDALVWDGTGAVRHMSRKPASSLPGATFALWKSRTSPTVVKALERSHADIAEIEDGFIRSVGLGANCVPPLSLIVDYDGIYFDPSQASDLERTIEQFEFDSTLCKRASSLRSRLVNASISKYGVGGDSLAKPNSARRSVLVTGQVEDDRSILTGGAGTSNLKLLQRARELEPGAWIIYKPHPDVEAGHRKGHIPEQLALRHADEVASDVSITALLHTVDAVHVITSLAGFEALLRGRQVTTHGVPFYAGWGLTRDLAPIPARRTRRRSLDELIAATLILYPRYLDPVSRLPCSPEVLVERMANNEARVVTPLIRLRELQGRLQRLARQIVDRGK